MRDLRHTTKAELAVQNHRLAAETARLNVELAKARSRIAAAEAWYKALPEPIRRTFGQPVAVLPVAAVTRAHRPATRTAAPRVAVVDCNRCIKGTFYWGAIINGVPEYSGDCFRCDGTGRIERPVA